MSALTSAGNITGLILLAAALITAVARAAAGRRSARPLVEDRVASAAALQLEEAVGAGHQQHAVPEPRRGLATRDR
jgi:hypothetical protein